MESNKDYALARLALLGLIASVQIVGVVRGFNSLDNIQDDLKAIQLDARHHHHQSFKGQQP